MKSLVRHFVNRWHDLRVEMADIDYQWAKRHAPEMASRKLLALYRAKGARIRAAARAVPEISMDALAVVVAAIGAAPILVHDIVMKVVG